MPDKVKTVGSKLEVWRGTAKHTSGGLKRGDLMQNKSGKIVSIAKHEAGMRTGKQNLGGYLQGAAPRRSTRAGRGKKVKGSGILSDIGSFFGLGLPPGDAYSSKGGRLHRTRQTGGGAYASNGGTLHHRRKGVKGSGIFGSIGDIADHIF